MTIKEFLNELEEVAPMLFLRCPKCKSRHCSINKEGECWCKECMHEFKIKEG